MVSGPTSVPIQPPASNTIRYRPDPGEPAVKLSAQETDSAILVHAQEQRNETRLRSQAIARGEDILFSRRTFTLGLGQQSPIFNGGLTEVITRTDSNGFIPDQPLVDTEGPQRPLQPAEEESNRTEQEAEQEEALQSSAEPTLEELEEDEQNLELEESRLERNLDRARLEQEEALQQADEPQLREARREERQIEREQREIEQEQRQVEIEKFEEQLEDFLDASIGAVEESAAAAIGMLDVMFGLAPNEGEGANPTAPLSASPGGPGFFARGPRI